MGFTSSATAVALGASVAAAAAAGGSTRQALRYLSLSSPRSFFTPAPSFTAARTRPRTSRIFPRFNRIFCTTAATADPEALVQPLRHSILLERLRSRHLKDSPKPPSPASSRHPAADAVKKSVNVSTFEELGLSGEVMGAVREMGITVPTEIQCIGVPAVLEGKSVVLGSHTGSGKTLAYMLPLVQLLRRDEEMSGMMMKPRRPRAVVLCPTRELCEQVFHVAKSVSHHARFRSTMISGGGRIRPQEDSLNVPIDMVVGTPGRILQHIEEGNIVYGDIKYLVLDEADTMFDRGFGPDIRKFLAPLKNRAAKADNQGFQTVLVTATMTMAVQKLIDEEFQGIIHLRTSTLHKKIASARHDFIKLSGSENKLESLLQVLEPSLAKGNRVMVFCNTLNSSRAVDHFLSENQISTVNYHGEVPAEERVENLKKFKSEEGDCPTLVCTDLAARGLDLDVDHVIMFDFPSNSIDYLHRTGRTARMGAKGKVTSLVAKKNQLLASRIEEAMRKNESLESLTMNNVEWDVAKSRQSSQKGKNPDSGKTTYQKNKFSSATSKTHKIVNKAAWPSTRKPFAGKTGKPSTPTSSRKPFAGKTASTPTSTRKPFAGKTGKPSTPTSSRKPSARKPVVSRQVKETTGGLRKESSKRNKPFEKRKSDSSRAASKLSVVGFRGRSSGKREPLRPQ